jgi:hypothetical protein
MPSRLEIAQEAMSFGECERAVVAGGGLETSPHPFRLSRTDMVGAWRLSQDAGWRSCCLESSWLLDG